MGVKQKLAKSPMRSLISIRTSVWAMASSAHPPVPLEPIKEGCGWLRECA